MSLARLKELLKERGCRKCHKSLPMRGAEMCHPCIANWIRKCEGCSIKFERTHAKQYRCPPCQKKARLESEKERKREVRGRRPTTYTCFDCDKVMDLYPGGGRIPARCPPCREAWRRKQDSERKKLDRRMRKDVPEGL